MIEPAKKLTACLLLSALLSLGFAPAPPPRPSEAEGDLKIEPGEWLMTEKGWPLFVVRLEGDGYYGYGRVFRGGTYTRVGKGGMTVDGRWSLPDGWLMLEEMKEGWWEPILLAPLRREDREGAWAGDYRARRAPAPKKGRLP